ncbi:MAG TPA: pilus assembly protein N-terminal domain-containing protein [Bryobacteraceae bacterium]|nr:pilus assembly protein N-terminal domain-containing protein [Bryobacteraceae bacterium]
MSPERILHHSAAAAAAAAAVAALMALAGPPALRAAELQAQNAPLVVTVGKSLVLDNAMNIQRISLANGDLAEAVAVNPREVLINGRAAGETSLIIWQQGGPRLLFDLTVRASNSKLDNVRGQLARELPDQDVSVYPEGESVFLHGTVKDLSSADRAAAIAGTLGKVVNLLHVVTPAEEPQILLKVRFADVDRSVNSQLGINLFSTGALNTIGGTTTGQFAPPTIAVPAPGSPVTAAVSNALNLFLFRPDLNLGATIAALESKNLLQILAEPNVMAMNGKQASFISGGEFPVPVVQGGSNIGAVTIQFREYGVKLNFTPTITPRGTIRLEVAPEVSSLDYSNGVVLNGFTVPALDTRKVQTQVELENGQSFAIAGLLNKNFNETLDKIPGIGDIPLLGKLFQSRVLTKSNSELLIMVTPEIVRPIPAGQARPEIPMPKPFIKESLKEAPRTPGIESTGPVPVKPQRETLPVEELQEMQKKEQGPVPGSGQPTLLLPLMMNPAGGQATPATPTAPLPGTGPSGGASTPTGSGSGTGTGQ